MFNDKDYKLAARHESSDGIGVKTFVFGPDLTDEESSVVQRLNSQINEELRRLRTLRDPEQIKMHAEIVRKLRGCFESHIHFKEIPNEYCSGSCCVHIPWLIATTEKGPIKIGWRKRVIQIDWSSSNIGIEAKDLFAGENVTIEGRMIHAWGYEPATRYLKALLQQDTP